MNDKNPSISATIKIPKPLNIHFDVRKTIRVNIRYFIIYITTNLLKKIGDENRFYVGKHIQLNDLETFDDYYGSSEILDLSIKKYGKDNFKREILEVCKNKKEMDLQEIYWIEKMHANKRKYPNDGGMNLNAGGYGGDTLSNHPNKEEIGKKISEKSKGRLKGENHPNYGKRVSESTREKMRESHKGQNKGRKASEEQKINMSKAQKGKQVGELNPMFGKTHSEESKEKMREKAKERFSIPENIWMLGKKGELNPNYGKKLSEEAKQNMKQAQNTPELKLKRSEDFKGDKNPNVVCNFTLSNGESYWEFFTSGERNEINYFMRKYNTNIILFHGITVERKLKDGKKLRVTSQEQKDKTSKKLKGRKKSEQGRKNIAKGKMGEQNPRNKWRYILSNNEDYWTFFNQNEKVAIRKQFAQDNSEKITYKDLTINRIPKPNQKDLITNV